MAKWSYCWQCWQQVVNKSCCQWLPPSDHLVPDRLLTVLHPVVRRSFPNQYFFYMVLIYDSRDNPSCFATTHVGDSQIRKHLILVLPCLLKIPPTKSWRSPLQLFQSIALAMSERENCLAGNLGERDIPELRSSWRHCALGRHSKAGNPLQEISDSAFESFTTIK